MKFGTHSHVPVRITYIHLIFPLAPSSGQSYDLSNTLVYDQVPAKGNASAVLCV